MVYCEGNPLMNDWLTYPVSDGTPTPPIPHPPPKGTGMRKVFPCYDVFMVVSSLLWYQEDIFGDERKQRKQFGLPVIFISINSEKSLFYSKFIIDIKENISQFLPSHYILNSRKICYKIKLITSINFQQI